MKKRRRKEKFRPLSKMRWGALTGVLFVVWSAILDMMSLFMVSALISISLLSIVPWRSSAARWFSYLNKVC